MLDITKRSYFTKLSLEYFGFIADCLSPKDCGTWFLVNKLFHEVAKGVFPRQLIQHFTKLQGIINRDMKDVVYEEVKWSPWENRLTSAMSISQLLTSYKKTILKYLCLRMGIVGRSWEEQDPNLKDFHLETVKKIGFLAGWILENMGYKFFITVSLKSQILITCLDSRCFTANPARLLFPISRYSRSLFIPAVHHILYGDCPKLQDYFKKNPNLISDPKTAKILQVAISIFNKYINIPNNTEGSNTEDDSVETIAGLLHGRELIEKDLEDTPESVRSLTGVIGDFITFFGILGELSKESHGKSQEHRPWFTLEIKGRQHLNKIYSGSDSVDPETQSITLFNIVFPYAVHTNDTQLVKALMNNRYIIPEIPKMYTFYKQEKDSKAVTLLSKVLFSVVLARELLHRAQNS